MIVSTQVKSLITLVCSKMSVQKKIKKVKFIFIKSVFFTTFFQNDCNPGKKFVDFLNYDTIPPSPPLQC